MKVILAMLAALRVPVSMASAARQAVAVAFLEPKTEVDIDVVSGALSVGGHQRPFYTPESRKERPELASFADPYAHGLFVYCTGGIPGLVEADRSLGPARSIPNGIRTVVAPERGDTARALKTSGPTGQ